MSGFNLFGKAGHGDAKYRKVASSDDEFSLSDEEEVLFKTPREIELNLYPNSSKSVGTKTGASCMKQACLVCTIVVVIICVFTVGVTLYKNAHHAAGHTNRTLSGSGAGKIRQNVTGPGVKWRKIIQKRASEGAEMLFDVDGDGLDDVILGSGNTERFAGAACAMMEVQDQPGSDLFHNLRTMCNITGFQYPCFGSIMALRGYDGKVLWDIDVRSEVLFFNCEQFDFDKDGKQDCIATGRMGTIIAFNPRNGSSFWVLEDDDWLKATWNVYRPTAMPDLDGDGIPEMLVANGGDTRKEPDDHDRAPGRLLILKGGTGKPFGARYYDLPNSRETYMSPVLYKPFLHTYILFGSGGETVSGDLMGINLEDFKCYVTADNPDKCQLVGPDPRDPWSSKFVRDANGTFIIHKGQTKGAMVTPVLADINGDGVLDVVASLFDGQVVLYDGKTATQSWVAHFPGMESYSTPAPGYYNDDDILDIMIHWNKGEWMKYSVSNVSIIDGHDGSLLWSLNSTRMQFSSVLTLGTSQRNLHKFVFSVTGRDSPYSWREDGSLVRFGVPDTANRTKRHGQETPEGEGSEKKLGDYSPEQRKSDVAHSKLMCDDDLSGHMTEVLMVDRTQPSRAHRILNSPTQKHTYDALPRCVSTVLKDHKVAPPLFMQNNHKEGDSDGNPDPSSNIRNTATSPQNNQQAPPVQSPSYFNNPPFDPDSVPDNPNQRIGHPPSPKKDRPRRNNHMTNGRKGTDDPPDGVGEIEEQEYEDVQQCDPRANFPPNVTLVPMCNVESPDSMSTGLISDFDGDGMLDYMSVRALHYDELDAGYCMQGISFFIEIKVVSLQISYETGTLEKVLLHEKTKMPMPDPLHPITEHPTLLPVDQQTWTQFMGKTHDSVYTKPGEQ
ncbi:uncharacterized protein LOC128217450 [Mya arenaria]|uniref:uncharacterized protein LOC128217450 n=1 Tax=Mya arenaria TaxID=6604 RepID=UPI0022E5B0D0|nr:uncharacterized protein LOC128217450 [Mya arenaria]